MSNNEQAPRENDGSSVNEQVPHSGVRGYEAPVTEFSTPLKDAHDRGLVGKVPENPGSLIAPERKKNTLRNIGVGIGGLATVVALGLGAKTMAGGGESTETQDQPGTSAPVTPGTGEATPSSSPEVEPTSPFGISVAENPTFEQASTAYYAQLEQYLQSGTAASEQAGDSQYLDALLGSDWSSNPEFAGYTSDLQALAVTISTNHYATGENGDPEYENNIEVTEVSDVVESDAEVSGNVTIHTTNNILETVLAPFSEVQENLDSYRDFHLTFSDVDGQWQLVEFDNLSTPE